MEPYDEPEALVDVLIEELSLSPFERAALGRQLARFRQRHSDAAARDRTPAAGPVPRLPEGSFRFFALDVETANHDRASICQVGLACVRPDDRIETWVTLVNPETDRWLFSGLHGITADMVVGAPRIDEVLTLLESKLVGSLIYQHSGFDRSAIRAACAALGRAEPDWIWEDSVAVARSAWPELTGNGGHGLASLKRHLGLRFEHHDAGEDARAAAEVVLKAESGVKIMEEDFDVIEDEEPPHSSFFGAKLPRHQLSAPKAEEAHADHGVAKGVIGRSILTQGNLNNNHIYLREFIGAFPLEVIGGGNRASAAPRSLSIRWGGPGVVTTDIDGAKKIFRDRSWVRAFFETNSARCGDSVEIFETAPLCYEVKLVRA
jgi:DNA polymerase III epsilon subunit-like protein